MLAKYIFKRYISVVCSLNTSNKQKGASLWGLSDEVQHVKILRTVRKAVIDNSARSRSTLSSVLPRGQARERDLFTSVVTDQGWVAALKKEVGRCYCDSDNVNQRGQIAVRIPCITGRPDIGSQQPTLFISNFNSSIVCPSMFVNEYATKTVFSYWQIYKKK